MKDRKQIELKKFQGKRGEKKDRKGRMIESKGGGGEKEREEREDEEGVKVRKEAEDGDKCDRDRMLGKVRRIWGKERWGVWMGREEEEQLKEIWLGTPSVIQITLGCAS